MTAHTGLEPPATALRFASGEGAVDLFADARTAAAVADLATPFFDVSPVPAREAAAGSWPSVVAGPDATPEAGDGWRPVRYSSDFEPDRELWVHDGRRSIALPGPSSDWLTTQVLRSVRNLLRWQAYRRGELFVHGGMVVADGLGIAFLGRKRAGKTSSIVSALLAGAGFVSNDDLVIGTAPGRPDELTGLGYPRTVNVRSDTLLALSTREPRLGDLFRSAGHPANGHPGKHKTGTETFLPDGSAAPISVWVRCAELAAATGAAVLPAHRVDAVVFPRFLPAGAPPEVAELDPAAARAELAEHIETMAVRFDPFLAEWFAGRDGARADALAERLATTVRCVRLHQSIDRLAEGTAALLATVAGTADVR